MLNVVAKEGISLTIDLNWMRNNPIPRCGVCMGNLLHNLYDD